MIDVLFWTVCIAVGTACSVVAGIITKIIYEHVMEQSRLRRAIKNPRFCLGDIVAVSPNIMQFGGIKHNCSYYVQEVFISSEGNEWIKIDADGGANFYLAAWFLKASSLPTTMNSAEYDEILEAQKIMEEINP